MRTIDQIEKIKKNFSKPFSVENFLSNNDIDHLIGLFNNSKKGVRNIPIIYKNTGPITIDLNFFLEDPLIKLIIEKLKKVIGQFEITTGFFFKTNHPHIIHNDDTYELPENVYKGITIPLKLEYDKFIKYPKLCFFDQHYFHGPAKFFKGSKDIPTYYNQQVYDYSNLDGLVDLHFIDDKNYFTHLKSQWLEGLSLHSCLDWIPGNVLIFDSVRLHCASDFRNLGIKSKLGISIFTKKC